MNILRRIKVMKKFETIKIEQLKNVPNAITCNKCGKTEELSGNEFDRGMQSCQFQTIDVAFGYGSKFDMDDWSFDLCEECLVDLVRTFKHLPYGYDKEYADEVYKK
jgi:hypothetical protein